MACIAPITQCSDLSMNKEKCIWPFALASTQHMVLPHIHEKYSFTEKLNNNEDN